MREFFRGWRRKFGCVTLVLSCVIAVAWARSVLVGDTIEFGFNGSVYYIESTAGRLDWTNWWHADGLSSATGIRWSTGPESMPPRILLSSNDAPPSVSTWTVHYWWLVLPCSILSAYLILWTPRFENAMGGFFHGWRRKVGVVTLVLALALWCVWVRSCVCRDSFDLFRAESFTTGSYRYWIQSHDGGIEYWKSEEVSLETLRKRFRNALDVNQADELRLFIHSGPLPWEDTLLWRVPYWSLTLPLTILTAVLLLWPQRKSIRLA